MILHVQKQIKNSYIRDISKLDRNLLKDKLRDVEVLFNKIRTWESRHNTTDLIHGIELSHYNVNALEAYNRTVFRVRLDYQEGNVIEDTLDDFFDFIIYASNIEKSTDKIRFSGAISEEGYDRQSIKKLIKTIQGFLMDPLAMKPVTKLTDFIASKTPNRILIIKCKTGFTALLSFSYGRIDRLVNNEGETMIINTIEDCGRVILERYYQKKSHNEQDIEPVEIRAALPGVNKLEEKNIAESFLDAFKCLFTESPISISILS